MNRDIYKVAITALVAFALAAGSAAFGQDDDDADFIPKSSAPPAKRTGGASRGGSSDANAATVSILAPEKSIGLTLREQPVVYWYLSADTDKPVEIAISNLKQRDEPLMETELKGPTKAGLQKLDLSKVKQDGKAIRLEPGVEYEVAIGVAASRTAGSENPMATSRILRVDPKDAPAAAAAAKEKDPARRATAYGKEGVWFDYIDALNAAVEASPKDESLVRRRAKALAAQGLVWQPGGKLAEGPAAKGAGKPKQ